MSKLTSTLGALERDAGRIEVVLHISCRYELFYALSLYACTNLCTFWLWGLGIYRCIYILDMCMVKSDLSTDDESSFRWAHDNYTD